MSKPDSQGVSKSSGGPWVVGYGDPWMPLLKCGANQIFLDDSARTERCGVENCSDPRRRRMLTAATYGEGSATDQILHLSDHRS